MRALLEVTGLRRVAAALALPARRRRLPRSSRPRAHGVHRHREDRVCGRARVGGSPGRKSSPGSFEHLEDDDEDNGAAFVQMRSHDEKRLATVHVGYGIHGHYDGLNIRIAVQAADGAVPQ